MKQHDEYSRVKTAKYQGQRDNLKNIQRLREYQQSNDN